MSRTLTARSVPAPVLAGGGATRILERNLLVYRRIWPVIASGFFEPIFYLFSIGIGIGELVGDIVISTGEAVEYTAFVAPALLAASAMNGAVFESTMNIFFKLKYGKVYDAILSTPMKTTDIAIGEIIFSLGRGLIYSTAFLLVMLAMGLIESPWGILALPATLLIGFAFAACGMAATTFMNSWQDFDMVNLVVLPLFLFSATFYTLDVYPPLFQTLTQLSPLYHGVQLIRSLTLGTLSINLFAHIGFLLTMGLAGSYVTSRRLEKLLLS